MKKFVYFIAMILLCVSCVRDTIIESEFSAISILNKTNDLIHVKLYGNHGAIQIDKTLHTLPYSEYYYTFEEEDEILKAEFDLVSSDAEVLRSFGVLLHASSLPDATPNSMVSVTFHRIEISFPEKDKATIIFTPEDVLGYSENIFAEDATWSYRTWDTDAGGSGWFQEYIDREHRYTFVISEDKITLE